MKKLLLSTLCMFTLATSIQAEVNALELIANDYKTSFSDLSLLNKCNALGYGALSSAATYIVTKAFENILSTEEHDFNFWKPQDWNWTERSTVTLGTIWVTKWAGEQFKPEVVAKKANEDGLLALLLETSQSDLEKALDEKFIIHHFPRATAFAQLRNLHNTINHLLTLITEYNAHKPHRNFKTIKEALKNNLKQVNNALLLIKKDARWHQECNAQTLSNVHATQQNQQNAELAGAAIKLAHAYTKAR